MMMIIDHDKHDDHNDHDNHDTNDHEDKCLKTWSNKSLTCQTWLGVGRVEGIGEEEEEKEEEGKEEEEEEGEGGRWGV